MITPATRPRQYHIDWLRVIAIFLVFVYHTLRPFSSEGFHVVNDRAYAGVDIITTILPIFGMPLVFLISGAGAFYALGKRSGGRYLWDRVLRLVVPFIVGMVTYIPLLVYLERVQHGDFQGNFPQFMAQYFDGLYAFGGDFAWMGLHLWYLALLFLFTLLMLPLMAWLRHSAAEGVETIEVVAHEGREAAGEVAVVDALQIDEQGDVGHHADDKGHQQAQDAIP